ncbi:MAG: peptide ABC transporter substrate-binding protein [Nocardioidaceae bacterium]
MNELFHDQSGAFLGGEAGWVVEPLFLALPDGTYEPRLAAEIPTVDNGGVSRGGRTVTYRLREGITWSDGKPFTAEDLVFTFDVFRDPDSTALVPVDYELVESVTARDQLTVEVQLKEASPTYLELWKHVMPAHEFESTAVTAEHPQARLPLGTGPFVFTDFKAGDEIALERNPDYWRDPDLPYLDGITLKIVPELEVATTSFLEGQYDTVFFFTTGDLPQLEAAEESGAPIVVETQETDSWVEWLFLNHSASGDPSVPHPVLGDAAIREAIDFGIDRQGIIDTVLGGFGTLVGSPIYSGAFDVDIPPATYDPDHARQVLDEAGWEPGSDGIRVKDGVRASLMFQTVSGDHTRELYQQIIQQNLEEVGIEMNIENVPSNIIFGGYEEGGLLATGSYDTMMSRDGNYVDPASWMASFTCDSIPNEQQTVGETYGHYCNPEFDELAQQAASTLDQQERTELYSQMAQMFHDERVAIPIYSSTWGWAWNLQLQGVSPDYWSGVWPSVAEWYLAP